MWMRVNKKVDKLITTGLVGKVLSIYILILLLVSILSAAFIPGSFAATIDPKAQKTFLRDLELEVNKINK